MLMDMKVVRRHDQFGFRVVKVCARVGYDAVPLLGRARQ